MFKIKKQLNYSVYTIVIALFMGIFGISTQILAQPVYRCYKLADGVTKKQLEAEFERYRSGEIARLSNGSLYCRDALPILEKYALDSSPKIRETVTNYLGNGFFSVKTLEILTLQIQSFPLEKSNFPVSFASRYPCYYFKKLSNKQLSKSLITRIKSNDNEFNRNEIYLLGCLSRQDLRAKEFLIEMHMPSFRTSLSEDERRDQIAFLNYPLAESGQKSSEETILTDFKKQISEADPDKIQSALSSAKNFTNCRIINQYISLINDKREISKSEYQNGEIEQIKGRVGDIAISTFTSIYGTEVTGERDVSLRPHSDTEMEKIYGRVKSFVKRKVINSCKLED